MFCTRGNRSLTKEEQQQVSDVIASFKRRNGTMKGGENHDKSTFNKRQVD